MRSFALALLAALFLSIGAPALAASPAPSIATLAIPGDPRFVAAVRDVLAVQTDYTPDFAAQSGLIDDAIRVPSFAPAHVKWTMETFYRTRNVLTTGREGSFTCFADATNLWQCGGATGPNRPGSVQEILVTP